MKQIKSIWWISLCVKLVLAALIPLSSDEAYYWVWSRFLDLSYYDHPAMVAWLFKLGDPLLWLGNAVRWPAVILGHLTLWVWYLILKDEIDLEKIKWYFYVTLFSPLLGFGSLVVTPDLPVLFFWSLSIYLFIRVMRGHRLQDYALFGLALGLGFCSKYHIVLIVPCVLLYLTVEKLWKTVSWKGVGITVLTGLVGCLPVIVWNVLHDFASIRFQLNHGLGRADYKFYWTWSYLIGQVLVIFPPVLYFALKSKLPNILKSLFYFAWVPLVFFFLTSFRGVVEINWPVVAYPAVLALAVIGAANFKLLRVTNIFWVVIAVLLALQIQFKVVSGGPNKLDELTQFKPLLAAQEKYQPLYCQTYQMCSWIWYNNKKPIYKLWGISRIDFFDNFDQGYPGVLPKSFYLAVQKGTRLPAWMREANWQSEIVEEVSEKYIILKVGEP